MCQITTALHHYPKKHGLSIEWIADHIGVPKSTLQRYLSVNEETALPFPLRLLIPFMNACNRDYSALDLLESRIGRAACLTGIHGKEVDIKALATLAKKSGATISVIAAAIEDQVIDEDENRECTGQLLGLQKEIAMLLVELNKK